MQPAGRLAAFAAVEKQRLQLRLLACRPGVNTHLSSTDRVSSHYMTTLSGQLNRHIEQIQGHSLSWEELSKK